MKFPIIHQEPWIDYLTFFLFFPQNKLKEDKEKTPEPPELVLIQSNFRGAVIGKNQKKLKEINEQTGAHLFVCDRNVYLTGSQEARKKAKMHIEKYVVSK